MNQDRINQLENFIKEDPNDPFLYYALATEYKEEQPEKAKALFDKLLKKFPEYIGTYFHAAALYAEHYSREKAAEIYEKGIEIAQKSKDLHALAELRNAFTNFQFDDM